MIMTKSISNKKYLLTKRKKKRIKESHIQMEHEKIWMQFHVLVFCIVNFFYHFLLGLFWGWHLNEKNIKKFPMGKREVIDPQLLFAYILSSKCKILLQKLFHHFLAKISSLNLNKLLGGNFEFLNYFCLLMYIRGK